MSVIQINSRHKFLEGFLGTKPEEDISHVMANEVNLWITVNTCMCCVLEIILYFVYNRMVNEQKNVNPSVAGPFDGYFHLRVKVKFCYNSLSRSIRGYPS